MLQWGYTGFILPYGAVTYIHTFYDVYVYSMISIYLSNQIYLSIYDIRNIINISIIGSHTTSKKKDFIILSHIRTSKHHQIVDPPNVDCNVFAITALP